MPIIDLPLPPSVNRLWRSNRGRVHRSAPYAAWLKEAGWTLAQQRPKAIPGCVSIVIAAGKPDKRRRDLDNIAGKAVLDLLTKHGVIEDDSKVIALSGRWDDTVAPGRLRVEIASAAAQHAGAPGAVLRKPRKNIREFPHAGTLQGKHDSNGQATMETTKRPARAKKPEAPKPEPAEPRRKIGRPSKYDPAFCERVLELGREGKSKTQIAAAIDVSRVTLGTWGEQHPDFLAALKRARELELAWWENVGQKHMLAPGFNATAFIFQMKNRFREEYRDVQTIDSTIRRPGDTTGISDADLEHLIRESRRRAAPPEAGKAKPDSVHPLHLLS
jgi:transposase